MASSNYASWSVVAGEQPTTAKWNILGTNDSSFNSGLGFNDSIIVNRHMALTTSVDANGWTVRNFGSFKIYNKRYTNSGASIGANSVNSLTLSPNLPVGISSITASTFLQVTLSTNNAYAFQWATETFIGSTSVGATFQPNATVSITGFWDMTLMV